jgi:hypothetical protein
MATRCDLREVRFDRWRINDLERALERIGAKIPLAPHGQGAARSISSKRSR